jgi:[acyl-carrier-protein] S-malonyltransferase
LEVKMKKTAFLFAGQGAQYVGMGRDLYDSFPECRQVFEEANDSLQWDLTDLIMNKTKEVLELTENTQPAVVTMSLAAYKAIVRYGIVPDVMAGLSLGEYSALTASGAFSVSQVVPLVRKRGMFMQEAVPRGAGKMTAILGLAADRVEKACKEAQNIGVVEPANYNCPGQIVIGGEEKAVEEAARIAKEKGALKIKDLAVSAPFHTSLLKPAAEKLKTAMQDLSLGELKTPVISNVDACYIGSEKEVKDLLYRQVMSSVLWEQILRRMIADGVRNFVEIGPGRTLSGFVRKIDRGLTIVNVENVKSLEAAVEVLSQKK